MIGWFRKRPVEIQALVWTGENTTEVVEFCDACYTYHRNNEPELMINTLEGPMKASQGDYIIRGIKGEFYACKPDIFELTYESV